MSRTVAELPVELGGVARYQALSQVVTRAELELAVAGGSVLRDSRGIYACPARTRRGAWPCGSGECCP
ncbi:hypothetical protein [Nocardioides sp.]|uniref:hypothetical protein n=1 Tax=Nocardioides sp. TaxID=35761 RepID=UPI0027207BFB|nr:hypothetical protein [Nocardioides sp.]MDO9456413.1 hypothetical protein [Nocardioides sp.]